MMSLLCSDTMIQMVGQRGGQEAEKKGGLQLGPWERT